MLYQIDVLKVFALECLFIIYFMNSEHFCLVNSFVFSNHM